MKFKSKPVKIEQESVSAAAATSAASVVMALQQPMPTNEASPPSATPLPAGLATSILPAVLQGSCKKSNENQREFSTGRQIPEKYIWKKQEFFQT